MHSWRNMMFKHFFKKRRIKKYAKKLPLELKAQYGHKKYYTKGQVDTALKRKRLYRTDESGGNAYAYVMYCSKKDYHEIQNHTGCEGDYNAMRIEIADTLFNNTSDFSFSNLYVDATTPSSSSTFSDSSGGFGGGDSGGGGE